MKVQQTSSQEVNLRRDATAATDGHSVHAAAVASHQQSTLAWKVGVWHGLTRRTNCLTRRTGLLGRMYQRGK